MVFFSVSGQLDQALIDNSPMFYFRRRLHCIVYWLQKKFKRNAILTRVITKILKSLPPVIQRVFLEKHTSSSGLKRTNDIKKKYIRIGALVPGVLKLRVEQSYALRKQVSLFL